MVVWLGVDRDGLVFDFKSFEFNVTVLSLLAMWLRINLVYFILLNLVLISVHELDKHSFFTGVQNHINYFLKFVV